MPVDIFKIGSVEMLVLLFLRKEDAHGYQLVQMLEEYSNGLLTVKTASLYPILYRLADNGCITGRETFVATARKGAAVHSSRVRVVYHIEPAGIARLEKLLAEHRTFIEGTETVFSQLNGGNYNGQE